MLGKPHQDGEVFKIDKKNILCMNNFMQEAFTKKRPINEFSSHGYKDVDLYWYINRYKHISKNLVVYIATIVYMYKLILGIGPAEVHRAFATCFTLAHKFYDDHCCTLEEISVVAGIEATELSDLESLAYRTLNFDLNIPRCVFDAGQTKFSQDQ